MEAIYTCSNSALKQYERNFKILSKLVTRESIKPEDFVIIDDKKRGLCTFLEYCKTIDDDLPDCLLFDGWQRMMLRDYTIGDDEEVELEHVPFEIYVARNKKLPPQSWFDKEHFYDLTFSPTFYDFAYENFSDEDIDKF